MSTAESPAVRATGLVKTYDGVHAVDGIDFEISRGECFGFLGPNGAGKTTTMRMIYRATPVGGGALEVLGFDATSGANDRELKRRIGVVPQEDNLDQELTVRENLEVFCHFYGLNGAESRERTDELLEFAELTERSTARVEALSGGMKRRLLIARGLIAQPDVIVLDEPTTGLDPRAREKVWDKMTWLKEQHATLLLSTHYMTEAERLCDRLVIMDRGVVVGTGTPDGLIREHVPPYVVEVRITHAELPDRLVETAERVERLRDRVLLFTEDGEETIGVAARELPDQPHLLRRTSLEDVFLAITGRGLDG